MKRLLSNTAPAVLATAIAACGAPQNPGGIEIHIHDSEIREATDEQRLSLEEALNELNSILQGISELQSELSQVQRDGSHFDQADTSDLNQFRIATNSRHDTYLRCMIEDQFSQALAKYQEVSNRLDTLSGSIVAILSDHDTGDTEADLRSQMDTVRAEFLSEGEVQNFNHEEDVTDYVRLERAIERLERQAECIQRSIDTIQSLSSTSENQAVPTDIASYISGQLNICFVGTDADGNTYLESLEASDATSSWTAYPSLDHLNSSDTRDCSRELWDYMYYNEYLGTGQVSPDFRAQEEPASTEEAPTEEQETSTEPNPRPSQRLEEEASTDEQDQDEEENSDTEAAPTETHEGHDHGDHNHSGEHSEEDSDEESVPEQTPTEEPAPEEQDEEENFTPDPGFTPENQTA